MELTKKERLGFIYQLRILEALYPEEAASYSNHRKALEDGYALHYGWMFDFLSDDMSAEDCRQVLEILDMYRAITYATKALSDGDELKSHHYAKFLGFDGNSETNEMGYTQYFLMDLDRFGELKEGEYPSFNSHTPMLGKYRRMLDIWKRLPQARKFEIQRDQLAKILEA